MWKKCEENNAVCLKKEGFRLILNEIHNESPILTGNTHQDFEISPVVVEEWKELWVKVEDSSGREVDKIYFGAQEASKIPYLKVWYSFTFRNYLGKRRF